MTAPCTSADHCVEVSEELAVVVPGQQFRLRRSSRALRQTERRIQVIGAQPLGADVALVLRIRHTSVLVAAMRHRFLAEGFLFIGRAASPLPRSIICGYNRFISKKSKLLLSARSAEISLTYFPRPCGRIWPR